MEGISSNGLMAILGIGLLTFLTAVFWLVLYYINKD